LLSDSSSDLAHVNDLGDEVSGKVIVHDPSKDDGWDLYVTVLDGNYAGKSGWMSALGASGEDGEPIARFDQAIMIYEPR
jgi:hypothetical protein